MREEGKEPQGITAPRRRNERRKGASASGFAVHSASEHARPKPQTLPQVDPSAWVARQTIPEPLQSAHSLTGS
eukprot:6211493-Pyramimonas_sp.AAC.1